MKKIGDRNDGYGYNNGKNNNGRYGGSDNNNDDDDDSYSNENNDDNRFENSNNNNNRRYDRYNQQSRYKRKAEPSKLHAQQSGNEWQQYPDQSFNNNNNNNNNASGRQSNDITDKSCIVQCFFHEMKLVLIN